MARVKIKSLNSKDQRRKAKRLEILSKNDKYVTRILPINDGFIIVTINKTELDKIFNNITDKELGEHDFVPQVPPQLKANRSGLIFKVDNHIYNKDVETIKE